METTTTKERAPLLVDLSFLRRRSVLKRAGIVAFGFAVAAGAYLLLAPSWYATTIVLVPAKEERSGLASSLLGGGLGLAAGLDLMGGSADVGRIVAILQSDWVTDAVIEKFDLRNRYKQEYQVDARKAVWEHCFVEAKPKSGLVELTCEDKDPQFLPQMLTYFSEKGNEVFRRMSVGSASEQVRFLEARVAELRTQADEAAARMRAFQEKHSIVDLESQARALVSVLSELNSQQISKELELDYARTFSSGDEAGVRQLRSQLALVSGKLRELESPESAPALDVVKGSRRRATSGVLPVALDVPRLRAEYEKLFRDRKVTETMLVFALQNMEAARADQARDVSTFQAIATPPAPDKRARPRRLAVLLAAIISGFIGSLAFDWWKLAGGMALVFPGRSEPEA